MLLCEEEALGLLNVVNKASTLCNCYDSLVHIYLNDRGSSKINGNWFVIQILNVCHQSNTFWALDAKVKRTQSLPSESLPSDLRRSQWSSERVSGHQTCQGKLCKVAHQRWCLTLFSSFCVQVGACFQRRRNSQTVYISQKNRTSNVMT